MQRNIWFMAISVIVVIILLNNTAYYFLTKESLEDALNREVAAVVRQIEFSVEQSRLGAERYQDLIGDELRVVSIAAQYALDPDVDKVTNEQLVELSAKLGVNHITLLKRVKDDILLYKSSDETQLGKSTKSWDPWFTVFNQLFDQQNVEIDWLGKSLPGFWSGPFEVASTDPGSIYKWGYYFDGTTNYITDPYISYTKLAEYEELTGVDSLIKKTIESNKALLEVTVLNPETFAKGPFETVHPNGEVQEHILQQPILYGSYNYVAKSDVANVSKAFNTKQNVTVDEVVNGKHVFKMFIPVFTEDKGLNIVDENGVPMDSYVLTLVSDYQVIRDQMSTQLLNIAIIIVLVTALSLVTAAVVMNYYRRSRDNAVQVTQQTYVDEINQMFHSIRAQRHDFLNHVQTIHSLAELNKHEELIAYTKELTGEIRQMNDIINIGNPAIAALIRSKTSQAESYRIMFECTFTSFEQLEMGVKTLDLNRILGNLIDNAFDETMRYPESMRMVELHGLQRNGFLEFTITNTCEDAEKVAAMPLFQSGYSTKDQQEHQGLGLSIVKSIVDKYKGTIDIHADGPDRLTFFITIPHKI